MDDSQSIEGGGGRGSKQVSFCVSDLAQAGGRGGSLLLGGVRVVSRLSQELQYSSSSLPL